MNHTSTVEGVIKVTLTAEFDGNAAAQREAARQRNAATLRIVAVDNGYIVTDMSTGKAKVYSDLGLDAPQSDNSDGTTTVAAHVAAFFKQLTGR